MERYFVLVVPVDCVKLNGAFLKLSFSGSLWSLINKKSIASVVLVSLRPPTSKAAAAGEGFFHFNGFLLSSSPLPTKKGHGGLTPHTDDPP